MRIYWMWILSLFFTGISYGQEKWDFPQITHSFKDVLGHYYLLQAGEELYKLDEKGTVLAHKTKSRNGPIHSVDVLNPFKIIVFYPQSKLIQLLDTELNILQEISLRSYMSLDIKGIGSTKEGKMVLLDADQEQWLLMDEHGQQSDIGLPFDYLNLEWDSYVGMQTNEQYWIIIFEDRVVVFDRYGAFKNQYPMIQNDQAFLLEESIYFLSHQLLIEEHIPTLSRKSIPLSIDDKVIGWSVDRNRLILHYPGFILLNNL